MATKALGFIARSERDVFDSMDNATIIERFRKLVNKTVIFSMCVYIYISVEHNINIHDFFLIYTWFFK